MSRPEVTPGGGVRGRIQTVLGAVDPSNLGVTLVHEHLLLDLTCLFQQPEGARERRQAREPVSLANLGWTRRHWNANLDNLRLDDERVAIEEALQYRLEGGGALVELSNHGLARDPIGLRRVARATGLHVVMGAGYYVARSHPVGMNEKTDAEIEEEIVRDLVEGVPGTDIRAGVIGELGCSWPLQPNEERVLRAAARAQRRTGAAISIHPGLDERAPAEIMGVLGDAGASGSRVIMGHLDRWSNLGNLRALARTGCYLGFDTFGQETWVHPFGQLDRLSDAQRVDLVRQLIAEGLVDRILLSHDIGYKHRLASYGGSGYAHILTTVLPQMRRKGVGEETIQTMLVDNPARVLQFA